jgi:hypothetical protein
MLTSITFFYQFPTQQIWIYTKHLYRVSIYPFQLQAFTSLNRPIHIFKLKLNSMAWVCEWTIPTERPPLVGELSANFFLWIEGATWSMDPYSHILGFLEHSRYFFFQIAPHLYSRGWVDPVPDPLLLRKSGSTRNRTRTSGSVVSIKETKTVPHT